MGPMGPIEMIMAGFDGLHRAGQVLDDLKKMDREETISLLNAVIVRKDSDGKVTASEDGDVHPGGGALFGALVGAIIGFLGGPGGAVIGAAAGAITGGITAAGIDMGFSNDTIEAIKDSLTPNSSAILALVEQEYMEPVVQEINMRDGRIIHTSLREEFTRRMLKERNKD